MWIIVWIMRIVWMMCSIRICRSREMGRGVCVAQYDIVGGDVHGRCDRWWIVAIVRRDGVDWNGGRVDGGGGRE